jgi:hypothetical protein
MLYVCLCFCSCDYLCIFVKGSGWKVGYTDRTKHAHSQHYVMRQLSELLHYFVRSLILQNHYPFRVRLKEVAGN